MSEVYHLDIRGFLATAASGLAGVAIGFSQVLLGFVLPAPLTLGVFLAVLVVFIALDVGKNKIIANVLCMINANIILNIPGLAARENLLPVTGGYLLAAALLAAICFAMRLAAKRGKKENAS